MKPGMFHARIAATTEMSAGIGLAVGLLTPIPAAGFVALMFVAAWTVHRPNGFFIVKEGWEYNLVLATAAVGHCDDRGRQAQPGLRALPHHGLYDYLHGWWGLVISLGLGLAGGIGQLAIFYRPPARPTPNSAATVWVMDENRRNTYISHTLRCCLLAQQVRRTESAG